QKTRSSPPMRPKPCSMRRGSRLRRRSKQSASAMTPGGRLLSRSTWRGRPLRRMSARSPRALPRRAPSTRQDDASSRLSQKRAAGENAWRPAAQSLRQARDQLARAREGHARLGARLESARERLDHTTRRIREVLMCAPEAVLANSGIDPARTPAGDELERRLVNLREDRERLGGVNLRAEEEAAEVAKQLDGLVRERDD